MQHKIQEKGTIYYKPKINRNIVTDDTGGIQNVNKTIPRNGAEETSCPRTVSLNSTPQSHYIKEHVTLFQAHGLQAESREKLFRQNTTGLDFEFWPVSVYQWFCLEKQQQFCIILCCKVLLWKRIFM